MSSNHRTSATVKWLLVSIAVVFLYFSYDRATAPASTQAASVSPAPAAIPSPTPTPQKTVSYKMWEAKKYPEPFVVKLVDKNVFPKQNDPLIFGLYELAGHARVTVSKGRKTIRVYPPKDRYNTTGQVIFDWMKLYYGDKVIYVVEYQNRT